MDRIDKAERLRKSANVTYEEAAAALDACNQDLLDAVVMLEKQGKTAGSANSTYSTDYQAQADYIDVSYRVEQQKEDAPTFRKSLSRLLHTVIWFIRSTSLQITRNDKLIFKIPSWVMAVIVLLTWRITIPAAVIALVFGFRYSFEGNEDTDTGKANSVLSKAGDIADDVSSRLRKESRHDSDD